MVRIFLLFSKDFRISILYYRNKRVLIEAQNNASRTNYISAKIDNTQPNSKCTFRGDRDETINYIIKK